MLCYSRSCTRNVRISFRYHLSLIPWLIISCFQVSHRSFVIYCSIYRENLCRQSTSLYTEAKLQTWPRYWMAHSWPRTHSDLQKVVMHEGHASLPFQTVILNSIQNRNNFVFLQTHVFRTYTFPITRTSAVYMNIKINILQTCIVLAVNWNGDQQRIAYI